MAPARPTATAAPRTAIQAAPGSSTPANTPKVTFRDATQKVMSLARVTRVTQLSDSALRARTRRTSDETYVTQTISMLISDTSDTTLELSAPLRAHAPTVRFNKTYVTSVTGLDRLPK